jgi:CubicO group peptidase (beta-lactamase class C family)
VSVNTVNGRCDRLYRPLRDLLVARLDAGVELGASLYVDIEGDAVVDLWGGWTDRQRLAPWKSDTIVNVWSTTKAITSLAVLMLVDRGQVDVDAPVADYWPEFAQNGKSGVRVRHLLSHTSGVPAWELPFAEEDPYDLVGSTSRLAAQPPWWEPGTLAVYHASTFGHLCGELVRRVTGLSLASFVREEVCGPVGADFHIGLTSGDIGRVSNVYAPPDGPSLPRAAAPSAAVEMLGARALAGSMASVEQANTDAWRRAEIGAANGHGNARSIGQIMSAIANGGTTNGVSLLSAPTIDLIFREQAYGIDPFFGIALRWGIGFALSPSEGVPFVRGRRTCFWGGWGGSMIIMNPERRVTICYVMNQMQPGGIGSDVAAAYCATALDLAGID